MSDFDKCIVLVFSWLMWVIYPVIVRSVYYFNFVTQQVNKLHLLNGRSSRLGKVYPELNTQSLISTFL